jgi:hypothetical protein
MSKTIKEIKERVGKKAVEGLQYLRIKTAITLLEEKEDGQKGILEAYVSIFNNVDLGGDKIIKGAFKESLKKKYPVGVWMHNWDEPIAKTLVAKEDDKGLYIKAQLIAGVQKADEAYLLLKEGVIDEFSIGYRVLEDEWEENGTRVLKKIRLYEWSPVLAGMNPDTELIGVKEEKKDELKAKFVYVNSKKRIVKIYYDNDTTKEIKIAYRYFKYLKSLDEKGAKVEPMREEAKKILRIRQAAKIIDKGAEFLLRITKN